MRFGCGVGVLVATVLAYAVLLVPSAEAVQVSCGQTISQDTKVSNDLTDCPGDGLVVDADGIVLDLNGHTIDGAPGSSDYGVDLGGDGEVDDVTVKNGKIKEFSVGVQAGLGDDAPRLIGLKLIDNSAYGIQLGVARSALVRNNLADGNQYGFVFQGASRPVVQGNTARDNTIRGFDLAGTADGLYAGNLAESNAEEGFKIADNSPRNLFRNDAANGNGGSGFRVLDGLASKLIDVTANGNSADGIIVDVGGDRTQVIDSIANNNEDDGIEVVDGADDVLLKGNRASKNDVDGFLIQDSDTTARSNIAKDNGDSNFHVTDGWIDLGGNKGKVS